MKKYIILVFICLNLIWTGQAAAIDGLGEVEIHGFVSQGFMMSDKYNYQGVLTEEGSWQVNELGLNFSANPAQNLRIGAQIFAGDYGAQGNDEFEVDWAYGDYRLHNYFGVRGGKFKIANGLYNEVRDIDAVRTSIFLPRSIYNERSRDLYSGIKGVCIYGQLPANFAYQAGYGETVLEENSNFEKDLATVVTRQTKRVVNDQISALVTFNVTNALITAGYAPEVAAAMGAAQGSAAGTQAASLVSVAPYESQGHNTKNFALTWEPRFAEGLKLSGTYYGGEEDITFTRVTPDPSSYDPATNTFTDTITEQVFYEIDEVSGTVASVEYIRGDTILSAEYNLIKVDITNAPTLDVLGWAVAGSHRFNDFFELGMYYSVYLSDVDDANGKDWERDGFGSRHERYINDACLSTRFDITDGWIFKLEGHLMRGMNEVVPAKDDDPGENDPTWYLFAAKLGYNF